MSKCNVKLPEPLPRQATNLAAALLLFCVLQVAVNGGFEAFMVVADPVYAAESSGIECFEEVSASAGALAVADGQTRYLSIPWLVNAVGDQHGFDLYALLASGFDVHGILKKYQYEQSQVDWLSCIAAEVEARKARVGLWSNSDAKRPKVLM